MRYLHLAALVAVALGLTASGRNLANVDSQRHYSVEDNTSAPAAQTDADGNELDCSATLQVKCPYMTTWIDVGASAAELTCPAGDPGVEYQEPTIDSEENTEWVCSPTDASAPADAIRGKQTVQITGTLSSCARSTLTAQSSCEYVCEDDITGETSVC